MVVVRPDGTRLAVTSTGSGPAVLLVHGYTANGAVWRYVASELAGAAAVHVVDLRGHGRSTPLRAHTTIHDMADDVGAVLDELDLTGAVLVGHSLGGMIVQQLAATRRELLGHRICALLLVNTSGNPMDSRLTRLAGSFFQSRALDLVSSIAPLRSALARAAFPTPVAVDRIQAQADMRPPARTSRLHFDVDGVPDLRPGNAHLTMPATVLGSTKDLAIPITATAELAESIADSRLRLVPRTGHVLPLERPDIVADEVRRLIHATQPDPTSRSMT